MVSLDEFEGIVVEIIPVIDLMGRIVVYAQGGDRKQYQPLKSVLTEQVDPIKVIADIVRFYSFKTFYIADLDAITDQNLNLDLYKQIATTFPQIRFLLDIGIQTQMQWNELDQISGIEPVIASESLQDLGLLKQANKGVLSLDFKNGEFLGKREMLQQVELWPTTVIVMNIDAVGAQSGPDLTLLKQIKKQREDIDIIVAGGVRNLQDLKRLEQEKVTKVLIASALHNGSLDVASIQALKK